MVLIKGDVDVIKDIQLKFHFINIIGAPRNGRMDIVLRLWGHDADPGIADSVASFTIVTAETSAMRRHRTSASPR